MGGTFGVVVHVTIRASPEPTVHASLPALNGAEVPGYYFIVSQYDYQGTNASAVALMLLFPGTSDTTKVDCLWNPFFQR